jgi:hypothetical protein
VREGSPMTNDGCCNVGLPKVDSIVQTTPAQIQQQAVRLLIPAMALASNKSI